jgi:PAS domain S-box-containing protein
LAQSRRQKKNVVTKQKLKKEPAFTGKRDWGQDDGTMPAELLEAENILAQLANVFFFKNPSVGRSNQTFEEGDIPGVTDVYRILVEQVPAIVFIAFFDKSFGEAYVSPQIEATLGFTQEEWLNDPVRWYQHIHPEDKERWSSEVAQMFLTGEPLHAVYRVLARDGREVRFQCEVKIVRHTDGHPWFIHGTAFDITKQQVDEDALRDYADRMEFLSRRLIEVQESERRLIALELHDQIGQILTGLKLKLQMLARLPAGESQERLNEAEVLVDELIGRTRELSLNLRPATLDHLGLLSALLRHLRHYTSQTAVRVDFQHDGLEGKRFAPEMETAAFRIVQEALTNIARHSGAEEAIVRIWATQNSLTLEINDDGRGFDPKIELALGQTSGVTGMRERASLLGGRFEIESGAEGTRLTAEWDFPDTVSADHK